MVGLMPQARAIIPQCSTNSRTEALVETRTIGSARIAARAAPSCESCIRASQIESIADCHAHASSLANGAGIIARADRPCRYFPSEIFAPTHTCVLQLRIG